MVSAVLLIAVGLLVAYKCYKYVTYRPEGFPPGPPRIPYVGSYLFLLMVNYNFLHKASMTLSKWYKSSTIGFYIGPYPTIVAHSAKAIREILNNPDFDGRPDLFVARLRDPHYNKTGFFFNEGEIWKAQRRFTLRYLRDFGFGRRFNTLEEAMSEEIKDMLDVMRNGPKYPHETDLDRPGQVICPYIFIGYIVNSFLQVMCNERIPRCDQEEFVKLGRAGIVAQRNGDDYGKLLSLLPWIRHIFPNWSGFKPLRESHMTMYYFVEKFVAKYYNSYEPENVRNFVDLYVAQMKKAEASEEKDNMFTYDHCVMSMVDFMLPAITTVSAQLSLLVQWLLIRTDVQKTIQKEIDEVVGQGRLPSIDDRKSMPYTEACIREGLRIDTLIPSNIPHTALVDTQLDGYSIPKGTVILPSLHAYHLDEDVWIDPDNYRPERFLTDNGELSLKKDVSLPFSAGKRLCAAETFSRNIMFLIITAICQNFDLVTKPGEAVPDKSKNLNGVIITPPDFWVNLVAR